MKGGLSIKGETSIPYEGRNSTPHGGALHDRGTTHEPQPPMKGEPQRPMKVEEHIIKGGTHSFKERETTHEGGHPMGRGPSCDWEGNPPFLKGGEPPRESELGNNRM